MKRLLADSLIAPTSVGAICDLLTIDRRGLEQPRYAAHGERSLE